MADKSIRGICLRGTSHHMASMRRPVIKRVDEEPTSFAIQSAFDRNSLSRKEDIADFLKMLLMVKPPYTFIVDSPWGTGKTFFVKQIEWILKILNPAFGANHIELGSQFNEILKDDLFAILFPCILMHGKMIILKIRFFRFWLLFRIYW
ncbi:MAG: P-loop NTPase fold protein [Collinsella sp.]